MHPERFCALQGTTGTTLGIAPGIVHPTHNSALSGLLLRVFGCRGCPGGLQHTGMQDQARQSCTGAQVGVWGEQIPAVPAQNGLTQSLHLQPPNVTEGIPKPIPAPGGKGEEPWAARTVYRQHTGRPGRPDHRAGPGQRRPAGAGSLLSPRRRLQPWRSHFQHHCRAELWGQRTRAGVQPGAAGLTTA